MALKDDNRSHVVTRYQHQVTSAEADMYGSLRAGALVNLLIQAAIVSADSLGFGLAYLRKNQLFWVLSRLSLILDRDVKWQENITIETWPRDIDGLQYLRDFVVRDTEENIIGRATSAWLCIDMNRKRPVKLNDENTSAFNQLSDRLAHIHSPEKLSPVTGEWDEKKVIEPAYSDFDLNGHVTTTRYIDWCMDSFTRQFHAINRFREMEINFIKEILPEEQVSLERFGTNGVTQIQGTLSDEKISFIVRVSFEKRQK